MIHDGGTGLFALKGILLSSVGLGIMDLMEPATSWEKVGIVGLLIGALIVLWRKGEKQQDKADAMNALLLATIERNTAALTAHNEHAKERNRLLVEVKEIVTTCPGRVQTHDTTRQP